MYAHTLGTVGYFGFSVVFVVVVVLLFFSFTVKTQFLEVIRDVR